jgi:SAM-dependent methyltransferase
MRIIKSHYLPDGKLFNDGRSVDLIQIEKEEDYDILINNIGTDYYNDAYFSSHIDYPENQVLELGCGRGDVLGLLTADKKIQVRGIENSQDILKKIWPFLEEKVDPGDILDAYELYFSLKKTFDTFCAFDLWEHLLPRKLHDYIAGLVELAEEDALFFFSIPAFGEDKVFGEIFPLELEENRGKFDARSPFDYLIVESLKPLIPAKGHLIWAHTEWWQKQFESHGLIRAEELERNVHTYFDEHLFYARKSFYIFHLDSPQSRHRVARLLKSGLTLFKKWKLLVEQQEFLRRFEIGLRKTLIQEAELKSTINHAEFYMVLDLKNQIARWTGKSLRQKPGGVMVRPLLSRLEKWADEYLDHYVRKYKKRHYLVG